jgi:hypothetical protein
MKSLVVRGPALLGEKQVPLPEGQGRNKVLSLWLAEYSACKAFLLAMCVGYSVG